MNIVYTHCFGHNHSSNDVLLLYAHLLHNVLQNYNTKHNFTHLQNLPKKLPKELMCRQTSTSKFFALMWFILLSDLFYGPSLPTKTVRRKNTHLHTFLKDCKNICLIIVIEIIKKSCPNLSAAPILPSQFITPTVTVCSNALHRYCPEHVETGQSRGDQYTW